MKKVFLLTLLSLFIFSLVGCDEKLEQIIVTSEILEAEPGETLTLNYQLVPENVTDVEVTWEFVAGDDLASINGNSLVINEDAAPNSEIKVKAKYQKIKSNPITVKVVKHLTGITISASKDIVAPGETLTLNYQLIPENATGVEVTWEIVAGDDLVSLNGNSLVVDEDAPHNSEIKIKAKYQEIESNLITVKVVKNLTNIIISASEENVEPGETISLSYQLVPEGITGVEITWEIVEGEDFASIEGNSLVVDEDAAPNSEIKVKAKYQEIESNLITIKVVRHLTNITISASEDLVEAGEAVTLNAVFTPNDATDIDLSWEIVEGSAYAFIYKESNSLFVIGSAPVGTEIKVRAKSGSIQSNVLTVTVYDPLLDDYYLILPYASMTVDINDVTKTLEARVYDGHMTLITDKQVLFTVIEGTDLLTVETEGQNGRLVPKGHGTATVRATIKGTDISDTVTVNVIVPPISLSLPEVFAERLNYKYTIGKDWEFPFAVNPVKDDGVTSICENVAYTFVKKGSSASSSEIGTYENGKIKFLTTGEITVKAISNSGSKREAEVSYTFNVNDGLNVTTFEELDNAIESASSTGKRLINIVVLEKVLPNRSDYGYDLVPQHIIDDLTNGTPQPFDAVQNTIFYGDGSYEIIGNNHRINLQHQRVLTPEEYLDYKNRTGISTSNIDDLFQFRPIHEQYDFKIYIRDLEIKGNCGTDFNGSISGENPKAGGVHRYAIFINKGMAYPYESEKIAVDTKIENVKITNFQSGMVVRNAFLALVKDFEIGNIFGTGVRVEASSLTFQDITIGRCGAASLELNAKNSSAAPTKLGADAQFTKTQEVRFLGKFDCTNYNDGNTPYLRNYQQTLLQHLTVVDLLRANLTVNLPAMGNVMNDEGEILFAALLFNELDDEGVIINKTQLVNDWGEDAIVYYQDMAAIDTTHKYVMVPLKVTFEGQPLDMGYIICYNLNYAG